MRRKQFLDAGEGGPAPPRHLEMFAEWAPSSSAAAEAAAATEAARPSLMADARAPRFVSVAGRAAFAPCRHRSVGVFVDGMFDDAEEDDGCDDEKPPHSQAEAAAAAGKDEKKGARDRVDVDMVDDANEGYGDLALCVAGETSAATRHATKTTAARPRAKKKTTGESAMRERVQGTARHVGDGRIEEPCAVSPATATTAGDEAPTEQRSAPTSTPPAARERAPGPNDVLMGRGARATKHLGNRRFRALIRRYKAFFLCETKKCKPDVAQEVVHIWRSLNPPGRFLTERCGDDDDRSDDKGKDRDCIECYSYGDQGDGREGAAEHKRKEADGSGSAVVVCRALHDVGDGPAHRKVSQALREKNCDIMRALRACLTEDAEMENVKDCDIGGNGDEHGDGEDRKCAMEKKIDLIFNHVRQMWAAEHVLPPLYKKEDGAGGDDNGDDKGDAHGNLKRSKKGMRPARSVLREKAAALDDLIRSDVETGRGDSPFTHIDLLRVAGWMTMATGAKMDTITKAETQTRAKTRAAAKKRQAAEPRQQPSLPQSIPRSPSGTSLVCPPTAKKPRTENNDISTREQGPRIPESVISHNQVDAEGQKISFRPSSPQPYEQPLSPIDHLAQQCPTASRYHLSPPYSDRSYSIQHLPSGSNDEYCVMDNEEAYDAAASARMFVHRPGLFNLQYPHCHPTSRSSESARATLEANESRLATMPSHDDHRAVCDVVRHREALHHNVPVASASSGCISSRRQTMGSPSEMRTAPGAPPPLGSDLHHRPYPWPIPPPLPTGYVVVVPKSVAANSTLYDDQDAPLVAALAPRRRFVVIPGAIGRAPPPSLLMSRPQLQPQPLPPWGRHLPVPPSASPLEQEKINR